MRYESPCPDTVKFKYSFQDDEQFKTLDLSRRHTTRTSLPTLTPISSTPLPLSADKVNDLKFHLQYIHPNSRQFHESFLNGLTQSSELTCRYLPDDSGENDEEDTH
ncbi:hypothetical protein PR048_022460 [Dryococelus australis]|uniref:Uncharacterized protein n=1 Tax=Dryococelus australis TaxID=614101 RepID=A0ABQ9H134_9NEOP|nr:hypothetical protein PR048_022460 [Dryococelus australis]